MCYLCTRACAAMGCHAISAVNRGTLKQIAPPFLENSDSCIGCGSCAEICPTGHIEMVDTQTTRKIWGNEFAFAKCDSCGEPTITEAYRDYAVKNRGLLPDYYTTCPSCKKKSMASMFSKVGS
jgi:bidirectional [NiFe] hydrogenase diaphorase subunit